MSINWLGILQPQDESLPALPGGCAQCHPSLGAKPNLVEELTEADYNNIDCLICHGPGYKRTVAKDEDGKAYFVPAEGIDMQAVVHNANSPTNETCNRCHKNAAGGPNFKHGDVGTADIDVHIAAGLQCIDCHWSKDHKIAGSGYLKAVDMPDARIACEDCHTDTPHFANYADILNERHARVGCQTCHIPEIARDPNMPTMLSRDYTESVYNEAKGLYGPTHEMGSNLIPEYLWWNGYVEMTPWPAGSIADETARITPWKIVSVTVPMDAATEEPVYIKQGVYKVTGDLDKAVEAGVKASGQEYSGEWEPVTEVMAFEANHSVAAASESLMCGDCHQPDGRLDFAALGYEAERASELATMLVMPHPTEGYAECTECHALDSEVPFPENHTAYETASCQLCHTPGEAAEAVTIPHLNTNREDCLLCHGFGERVAFSSAHEGRGVDSCENCHQVDAAITMEQNQTCIDCHTNQETLMAIAEPVEQEAEPEEAEGEG